MWFNVYVEIKAYREDRPELLEFMKRYSLGLRTTMFIIFGILAFIASPGKWPETGNFFDGFFNQTCWPKLLMRTALMFGIAAAFAIVVATRIKNDDVRAFITRAASKSKIFLNRKKILNQEGKR